VQFAVGFKIQGKTGHVVVDAEDALIAALEVKMQRPEALITRFVVRRTCSVVLVGVPNPLSAGESPDWAICHQLCRVRQHRYALDNAAALNGVGTTVNAER
jgi:hypothetical protein